MIKVAHIYASNAKRNSGDFMIGIATKKYFEHQILNKPNDNLHFYDLDCRNSILFNSENILSLNDYDYIIVGAGGLILPDSSPNMISCWQWVISEVNIKKIIKPIYVISIGWNMFYNQTINMSNRNNNTENKKREVIFTNNIKTLIDKSVQFTLRHNKDVESLLNVIGDKYKNKINYEMCPTIWYVKTYWKPKIKNIHDKYFAIEIKDDRQWRRYYKISKSKYYIYLMNIIKTHIKNKEKIVYLSHDGSNSFYQYLKQNNINIPYLDNSSADEKKILDNFSKIHTIYCSAGHSQMISYGLGIKIISLVSHPKLKNFCDDIGDTNYININNLNI